MIWGKGLKPAEGRMKKDRGDTMHGGALSLRIVKKWSQSLGKPCYGAEKLQPVLDKSQWIEDD